MSLTSTILFFLLIYFSNTVLANSYIDKVLHYSPFSQPEKLQLLQGELVTTQIEETTDHELAVMMAFLVKTSANEMKNQFNTGIWIGLQEKKLTYINLPLSATKKDFLL